jgi:hypothetical protein
MLSIKETKEYVQDTKTASVKKRFNFAEANQIGDSVRIYVENKTIKERILIMLYTIAVILIVLWLIGLVTSTTMGGFIHVLLVIAIVVILVNVISGRKPL